VSDFTELRDDLAAIAKAVDGYSTTAVSHLLEQSRQIDRLWTDSAELRDEINAVANRVESLTRAVMADPSDVARAIVNDANRSTLREVFVCRLNPGCNISRPHVHDESGAVILVSTEEAADTYLSQRAQRDAILGLHRRKA
jgi:hypothetical protein